MEKLRKHGTLTLESLKMMLTVAERKHRFPHGAVKEIAAAERVSSTTVSRILSETWAPQTDEGRATERRIRVRIARKLGMRVDDVFPQKVERTADETVAA